MVWVGKLITKKLKREMITSSKSFYVFSGKKDLI